jgi:predicted dehydrogenase
MSVGIGIIGCGNVFPAYMKGLAQYDEVSVVRCSDIILERAEAGAERYDIPRWGGNAELLNDPDVDVVINLTPVIEHVGVSRTVLAAGKHLYSEKVIAISGSEARELLALAAKNNVTFGGAPDTFLGTWGTTAKHLVDTGAVGELVAASACFAHNRVEARHPEPEAFFLPGGGPLFELGPYYVSALVHLLGPVVEVAGRTRVGALVRHATAPERLGAEIPVEVPTHGTAVLTFASGVVATVIITFDIWASELPLRIELYGTDGTISVPHPNWYDGDVKVAPRPTGWENDWEVVPPMGSAPECAPRELIRGPGVIDLVHSLDGERHQTSGAFAAHVLDVLLAIQEASDTKSVVTLAADGLQPTAGS